MYCLHCGKQTDGRNSFCTACGMPLPKRYPVKKRNILGLAAGAVSAAYAVIFLCICWPVILVQADLFLQEGGPLFLEWLAVSIVPLAASILSSVAFRRRDDYEKGNMLTLAGLIIGWSGFAACAGMACAMLFMLY